MDNGSQTKFRKKSLPFASMDNSKSLPAPTAARPSLPRLAAMARSRTFSNSSSGARRGSVGALGTLVEVAEEQKSEAEVEGEHAEMERGEMRPRSGTLPDILEEDGELASRWVRKSGVFVIGQRGRGGGGAWGNGTGGDETKVWDVTGHSGGGR